MFHMNNLNQHKVKLYKVEFELQYNGSNPALPFPVLSSLIETFRFSLKTQ